MEKFDKLTDKCYLNMIGSEKEQFEKAIQEYDKYVEQYFLNSDFAGDEDELFFEEDELPFR